jgi:RNA methyltransferase, TrmH family
VQRLRRLLSRPSVRHSERAFVAEGAKIIEVALRSGSSIETVFVAAEGSDDAIVQELVSEVGRAGARIFDLGPGVMERVADTVTPQPVCAVVASLDVTLESVMARVDDSHEPAAARPNRLWLVCVDVRDPGNLGSILRVAAASGVAGAIVCTGSVDPYNPKTVRASAGAIFQIPFVKAGDASSTLAALRAAGCRLVGTAATGGTSYLDVDFAGDVAFVLGNEASGLPGELDAALDACVTIPMAAGPESLNVAVAAAVLCFEAARRGR